MRTLFDARPSRFRLNPENLSRRAFLRLSAGVALVSGAGLLSACSASAPAAQPGSATASAPAAAQSGAATTAPTVSAAAPAPTVSAAAGGNVKSVLPTYVAPTLPFKADLPGDAGKGIDDGYLTFPANPYQSVTDTVGTGKDINVFSGSAWPPFTPLDQNPVIAEMNKRMNINLKLDITTISDYAVKYNTMITGGDLPDVVWIGGTPNLVDFLKNSFADLTPFLAGDAVKDYPNLAALRPQTWKGTIFGGAIMGLPSPLGAMGQTMIVNMNRWEAEVGKGVVPKDPDDFKKMLQQLTDAGSNKWAIASNGTDPYGTTNAWFAMMFGAPNGWGTVNGKLSNYRETEAYKQSISYLRDLVQAGVFHPKSPTYDGVASKADQAAGQFALTSGSSAFYGNFVDMWNRGVALNPAVKFDVMRPIPAVAGQTPTYWLSPWIWPRTYLGPGIWAFKKAPDDRIKELLRVWNWIAGPFGSQERLLWEYGVEGTDWTRNDKGDLVTTQRGPADSTFLAIRFGPHSYDPLYNPGTPDYATAMNADEVAMLPLGTYDATLGVFSQTDATKSVPLNAAFQSIMVDIVAGRRPVSDYDQAISDWRSNGGDQIRAEYEAGIAAAQ
ncbi:MAG: extracellular solute-binding protein [Chloroflexi bacterium]|nr:extracellular solute-binding protein [Chloroflexota bacterium]